MFYDAPAVSSGALLSGRLKVTPLSGDVVMESIIMFLEATVTTKKPVADRCRECASQVSDLYEWDFFRNHAKTFKISEGMQELPFSHLIPGHLPATIHGQIGSIDYSLHVRAKTSDGQETEFQVEDVQVFSGYVMHIGVLLEGKLAVQDEVVCTYDEVRIQSSL